MWQLVSLATFLVFVLCSCLRNREEQWEQDPTTGEWWVRDDDGAPYYRSDMECCMRKYVYMYLYMFLQAGGGTWAYSYKMEWEAGSGTGGTSTRTVSNCIHFSWASQRLLQTVDEQT